ncbi:MAG: nitroreductase family protein [Candidatus Odinarchaeota archaeon]
MPIEGIDINRCSLCKCCIKECPRGNYGFISEEKKIFFDSSQNCILCGHCIAVCPEEAIIYTDMYDQALEFKELNISISNEELNQLLRLKRSIRQYKNKQIPKEIIEKIIDCMKCAPTAMNKRSLECLVISSVYKINELIDSIIEAIEDEVEHEEYIKKREEGIDPFFHNAPHILIFHSDNKWDSTNATIAITYGMLYAAALDLGSCWIGGVQVFLNANKEIKKRVLGIVDEIFGIMIIGIPEVRYYRAPPRPPIKTEFIS